MTDSVQPKWTDLVERLGGEADLWDNATRIFGMEAGAKMRDFLREAAQEVRELTNERRVFEEQARENFALFRAAEQERDALRALLRDALRPPSDRSSTFVADCLAALSASEKEPVRE